jgi:hypothetical protein
MTPRLRPKGTTLLGGRFHTSEVILTPEFSSNADSWFRPSVNRPAASIAARLKDLNGCLLADWSIQSPKAWLGSLCPLLLLIGR